ncbi:tetratricopeptide repeat protein [Roseibium sp.]|uniref:tetratricopeptide repeat protein n=1 Tax=Roseibium sp. TaxID=1936156 RepID=UPI003D0DD197
MKVPNPDGFAAPLLRLPALLVLCLSLLAAPAGATTEQDTLFEALKNAPNEAEARKIEDDIWYSWLDAAPTADIRQKVDDAMRRRGAYDFKGAKELLDQVVVEAPDYSEGWNQRAFILFLQGNYEASLEDIERTLALEPRHFGALSGRAIIFMTQGRVKLGQKALKEALAIHPFLKERSMLIMPEELDL